MTGINRLRTLASEWDVWGLGGLLADVADELERELREERDRWDSELCEAQMDKTRVTAVYLEMSKHVSGVEGAEDSPVARWARELREALKSDTSVKRPAPKVLDADGVDTSVGDTVYDVDTGEKMWVCALPEQGAYQCVKLRLINGMFETLDPCRLTHRAPVLAADGKPLREGETVWDMNGDELVIGALEDGGHTITCRYADLGDSAIPTHGSWSPCDLTHDRPVADTWERLEEDVTMPPGDYCDLRGVVRKDTTIASSVEGMTRDLVRRAKKLAERGR